MNNKLRVQKTDFSEVCNAGCLKDEFSYSLKYYFTYLNDDITAPLYIIILCKFVTRKYQQCGLGIHVTRVDSDTGLDM